tara:strand:- start:4805 stop:5551 length:747 start_codon:yes stop_codon:yes gene_type:complete
MTEKNSESKKQNPVKEHCPTCDGERTCDIHGHVYVPWHWEDRQGNSMSGGVDHSLLQCRGCETVFYLDDSWNENDVDHWYDHNGKTQGEAVRTKVTHPRPENRTKPVWFDAIGKIDAQLQYILDEMYVAYNNQAYILTAIGLRTALDRGTEVLSIDPAKTFAEKLAELQSGGWIGATEHDILGVITDAGNAAAHRGWSPDETDATQLLDAMEVFLQRAFIVGQKALSIRNNIPAKPRRKKAKAPAKTT